MDALTQRECREYAERGRSKGECIIQIAVWLWAELCSEATSLVPRPLVWGYEATCNSFQVVFDAGSEIGSGWAQEWMK